MDRMLYVGMTGAKETLFAQGLNNHNLANANTTAFRADLEQFRSMPAFGPGHPSRVYSMTERPGTDFTPGAINTTGRPLDIAIKGEGWIAVEGPDGQEAYTRAGDLRMTAEGFLTTGTGLQVMGNGGPINIPPSETLTIGTDGVITIKPIGQEANALAEVDRIKLVNPGNGQLEKSENGLMVMNTGEPAPADANVRIMTGALERSNVSVVEAMAKMITLSRNFEMQMKVMKTAQEVDQSTDALMRVG